MNPNSEQKNNITKTSINSNKMDEIKEDMKLRHDIRVITFNLLSPDTTRPEWFPYVDKNHLSFPNRVERVKDLMKSFMKVNFIICLQELNKAWVDNIEQIFKDNNYDFHYSTYKNNEMGVGIAYPKNHYDLLEIDRHRCADTVREICSRMETETFRDRIDEIDKTIITDLTEASKSDNILLTLLLGAKYFGKTVNKNLVISTYHTPCKFNFKYWIPAHVHACKKRVSDLRRIWNEKYSNTESIVLAGDFNLIPSSPAYRLLIDVDDDDDDIIEVKNDSSNLQMQPLVSCQEKQVTNEQQLDIIKNMKSAYALVNQNLDEKFRSAYFVCHGQEPKYTNVTLQADKTFIECLDYIVINKSVDVRSATVGLTVDDPTKTAYPTRLCPSDHLPMSASLRIL